jgi:hypothetical protein
VTGVAVEVRSGRTKAFSQYQWKGGARSMVYEVCPLLGIVDLIANIKKT